jgi:N-acyl-D-aspartate/D-glutamate deacylase
MRSIISAASGSGWVFACNHIASGRQAPQVADLVLTGGLVVDGTGAPARMADVHIVDGRIASIAPELIVDASRCGVAGAVVCPGFVDIHTHSDLTLLANPTAPSKVHQGVTTEVVGNCGLGVAPLVAGANVPAIRSAVSYLDLDPSVEFAWHDVAGYLDTVADAAPSLNVASLVGHLPLHAGVVGFGDAPAGPDELDAMCGLLGDALDAGALGLSTGLIYAPLTFADEAELAALAGVVAARGKVFTWHVRNYDDNLIASVQQAVDVARRTGCRTQISHLAAVGKRNWGAVGRALDVVDEATSDGLTIGVDIYPYLHGSAPLSQLLPAWTQQGGDGATRAQLHRADVRAAVRHEWLNRPTTWQDITISWTPGSDEVVGRTVAEIATQGGVEPAEVALDLLADLGSAVLMVAGGRSEDDLRTVLNHPRAVVASDGLALDPAGVTGAGLPHPRSYGCFPRYLARYGGTGRDELPAAIARCTSAPAALIGLTDRGVLRPGAPADIVVLHPDQLTDLATFTDPHQFPAGIDLVLVNGEPVVDGASHTGARPGAVLRA